MIVEDGDTREQLVERLQELVDQRLREELGDRIDFDSLPEINFLYIEPNYPASCRP